jgi:hypothetical protein
MVKGLNKVNIELLEHRKDFSSFNQQLQTSEDILAQSTQEMLDLLSSDLEQLYTPGDIITNSTS